MAYAEQTKVLISRIKTEIVKGGGKLCHVGGVKLYHLGGA